MNKITQIICKQILQPTVDLDEVSVFLVQDDVELPLVGLLADHPAIGVRLHNGLSIINTRHTKTTITQLYSRLMSKVHEGKLNSDSFNT